MKSPCRDCEDRTVGCHANCDRYKTFADKVRAQRERRARECEFIAYQRAQITKTIRKKRPR